MRDVVRGMRKSTKMTSSITRNATSAQQQLRRLRSHKQLQNPRQPQPQPKQTPAQASRQEREQEPELDQRRALHQESPLLLLVTAQPTTIVVTHPQRYSSTASFTTATTATAATTTTTTSSSAMRVRPRTRTKTSRLSSRLPVSLASANRVMSLLIPLVASCFLMSLFNLTHLGGVVPMPQMVVAVEATTTNTLLTTNQQPQQISSTSNNNMQQSNSVIQYPTTSLTSLAGSTASSSPSSTTPAKAKYKTMYACEDRQLMMDCEAGSRINLIRANYGRFSITQCNEQGQLDLSTDCMSPITFRIMQERCQNKQRCSVNATSTIFGDRCPKTRKYLEVHFQCQQVEPDHVDLRERRPNIMQQQTTNLMGPQTIMSAPKPPNNPTTPQTNIRLTSSNYPNNYPSPNSEETSMLHQQPQPSSTDFALTNQNQPQPVMNSPIMNPSMAINQFDLASNMNTNLDGHEQIIVSMRHFQIENMSRPRCYQWDTSANQWTDRGARLLETNQTHTTCAFDRQTIYVLVMDFSGPNQMISPVKSGPILTPSSQNHIGSPIPDILDNQPVPLDQNSYLNAFVQQGNPIDSGHMIYPPTPDSQQHNQQQTASTFTKLIMYSLGVVFVAIALMTLTFAASSMRSSAGAALKSLGNFTPFSGGPKYKHRRPAPGDPSSLHSNKDLLVINNANGHQFIYAPASATKISSSSSTHILSTAGVSGGGLLSQNQQQGTLHRLQQQQMYSGNGATLSSLSGTGAQSNNYYYGLMGLNPLQQQQQHQHQQQHHFSQHHLNNQPQQAQLVSHQQQQVNSANANTDATTTASYNQQANKSTISNESAQSSSSSGFESGSTSMQQQQARTQQACLLSAMNNNDFHLMGHHISNYGQHPQQQHHHNLFATLKGANITHQPHQHQPTFTVNAHYSTSGAGNLASGLQSINMTATNHQAIATSMTMHQRQTSNQLRDHIYECVDDEKPYMARLLMPTTPSNGAVANLTSSNSQHQIFDSPTFMSTRRAAQGECSSRLK